MNAEMDNIDVSKNKQALLKVDEILAEFLSKKIKHKDLHKSHKKKHKQHKKSKLKKSHKKKKSKRKKKDDDDESSYSEDAPPGKKYKSNDGDNLKEKAIAQYDTDSSGYKIQKINLENNIISNLEIISYDCAEKTESKTISHSALSKYELPDAKSVTNDDLKSDATTFHSSLSKSETFIEHDGPSEEINHRTSKKCSSVELDSNNHKNSHTSKSEIKSESLKENNSKKKEHKKNSQRSKKYHKRSRDSRSRSRSVNKSEKDSDGSEDFKFLVHSRTSYRSRYKKRYSHSRSHSRSPHRRSSHYKRSHRSTSSSSSHDKSSKSNYSYKKSSSVSRSISPTRDDSYRVENCDSSIVHKIDKDKLLEIARKNAVCMMQNSKLPNYGNDNLKKNELVNTSSCRQSVAQLTDFCKTLVENDHRDSSDEDATNHRTSKSDDEDGPFIVHPFKISENKPNIVMNIRNAVQVPVKTPAEQATEQAKLRIQFPVSSGSQHRVKESEWVPVEKKDKKLEITQNLNENSASKSISHVKNSFEKNLMTEASIQTQQALDLGQIVSERLSAVRKLQDNPHDVTALNLMYKAQQKMQSWVQSKQLPGQFTGATNTQILTPDQLSGPYQAWVRKDQFHKAQKVEGGMGMYLLQKMGWQPGKGLGKNNEGSIEPLVLDIKTDKKGLVSQGEVVKKNLVTNVTKDLSGKHPVSALTELCTKRKWGPPEFTLIFDDGPDHKKNFLFKVRVNGMEYQPTVASSNKKNAKLEAATVCLQKMGLLSKT